MKPYLEDYAVINPDSEREVAEILADDPEVIPLAGGTDLFVSLKNGVLPPSAFLNMKSCPDFEKEPELTDSELILEPLTTISDVRYDEDANRFRLLYEACKNLSVISIQNLATWAGNVANASPCANGAAALMAYDATLELAGVEGTREVKLTQFYRGYKELKMEKEEYIRRIKVPRPEPGWKEYYRDVGPREYQAISKTLLAGRIQLGRGEEVNDVRLVAGSVYPHTLKLRQTEDYLRGRELTEETIDAACEKLQEEIQPVDDVRSNRQYRRRVTENMLREFLQESRPL